jgi:hypothetical protein
MPRFPFKIPAREPYAGPGGGIRVFGYRRDGGARLHAGCDLYAPVGTPIFAIADGEVILAPYPFYLGTHAIEVYHKGVGVVRYGEVLSPSKYPSYQTQLIAGYARAGVEHPRVITAPRLTAGMKLDGRAAHRGGREAHGLAQSHVAFRALPGGRKGQEPERRRQVQALGLFAEPDQAASRPRAGVGHAGERPACPSGDRSGRVAARGLGGAGRTALLKGGAPDSD